MCDVWYLLDEVLYFLLVDVEHGHVLLLVLLRLLKEGTVLSHELVLDAFKLFIQHYVLKRAHNLIEIEVLRRCSVI